MAQNLRQHFANRILVDPHQPSSTPRNLRDVADGTVLVGQIRQVMDDGTQSSLIIDVELLSAEWVFQFSIENESKGSRSKEESTELGMSVTSGKEVSDSVSASAGFSGFGFSAEVSGSREEKTFTAMETSTLKKVVDTYTCPPESAIFVYKRRYKFRCRVWFFAEAQNAWIEDPEGNKIESRFTNEITANQELISPVALTGQGRLINNPPPGLAIPTKGLRVTEDGGWLVWWLLITVVFPWAKDQLGN